MSYDLSPVVARAETHMGAKKRPTRFKASVFCEAIKEHFDLKNPPDERWGQLVLRTLARDPDVAPNGTVLPIPGLKHLGGRVWRREEVVPEVGSHYLHRDTGHLFVVDSVLEDEGGIRVGIRLARHRSVVLVVKVVDLDRDYVLAVPEPC